MKLSLLILALLVCGVSGPKLQATVDKSQIETSKILCVVDITGLPVPVRFQDSITLTQAIKQAGVAREEIKNRVLIFSRRQDNMVYPTKLDLKRIEKGNADFKLNQHDIVFVEARKKQSTADVESIYRSCETCGCRLMPLMHGGHVPLPIDWNDSNAPVQKNPDPNNQKP